MVHASEEKLQALRMGLSRKISRIGKTKKEKEATKLIKSNDQEIQKQSHKVNPAKALKQKSVKTQKSSRKSKYVTQGMVDYVTLLRSRKSGPTLRKELMDSS